MGEKLPFLRANVKSKNGVRDTALQEASNVLEWKAYSLGGKIRLIYMRSHHRTIASFSLAQIISAALVLAAAQAPAATQLLLNPSFEQNVGNHVATGWTYFDDPTISTNVHDYWIGGPPTGGFQAPPVSGSNYWKEWGAGYFPSANNVAGIQQTFGSSAGSVYQASGWVYTSSSDLLGVGNTVWLEVAFLNGSGQPLALYTSADFTANTGADTWFQLNVTNSCDLSQPVATGDPFYTNYAVSGTVSQMVAPAGTTQVRYRFDFLQDNQGGGSCFLDDAALNQAAGLIAPVISNVYPQNMIFVPASSNLTFDVASPSGTTINNNAIHLVLNGVDVSSQLLIASLPTFKSVAYQHLESNTTYNAAISVSDTSGLTTTLSNYFQTTWVGLPPVEYLWEAEDFDFTNGLFIDNPDICNADGDPNCYFGKVGTPGVDENSDGESVSHLYRAADAMNIDVSGDFLRPNLFAANRTDYELNPFEQNEWVNYTRDFSNGVYWVVGRLATDLTLSGSLTMSVVNSDQTLTPLGTFTIAPHGLGWTTFENVFLLDTNGNKVNVTLNGKTTLQVESQGNILPNFFALVQAIPDLPIISGMYPDGAHPFQYTNALRFNASTLGSTFGAQSFHVVLDGFDVSSDLVITGSASNKTVVYPNLQPNARHVAVITITNGLDHGISVTNSFDTFSQNNYMVQASDFDFNSGMFISDANWYPNAYDGEVATTNIDYQHTTIDGEQYPYRPDGIPQEQGHDFLTDTFVNSGGIEYDLAWFGAGDWANYTRVYPKGKYYIYMRTAGLGTNTQQLELVTSGAGTVDQTVKKLGDWTFVGQNNSTYAWVPLTDDGLQAPFAISLGGMETLRLTTPTGDCYPNYFMLVPAAGITLSAAAQAGNAVISFPTQNGVVYSVFYRDAVGSGSWTLLTKTLGNGSVETVNDAASGSARFYMVTSP